MLGGFAFGLMALKCGNSGHLCKYIYPCLFYSLDELLHVCSEGFTQALMCSFSLTHVNTTTK